VDAVTATDGFKRSFLVRELVGGRKNDLVEEAEGTDRSVPCSLLDALYTPVEDIVLDHVGSHHPATHSYKTEK
jgi:hypothetical protein